MIAADVAVYAATSAGVCAAVAAAHGGTRVVLLEPGRHIGGQAAGVAAALAARSGMRVQQVDVDALQARLRDGGAVLAV